jgi:TRAP-type mannitol/chloroaromatic compound transport system permease large subunit
MVVYRALYQDLNLYSKLIFGIVHTFSIFFENACDMKRLSVCLYYVGAFPYCIQQIMLMTVPIYWPVELY